MACKQRSISSTGEANDAKKPLRVDETVYAKDLRSTDSKRIIEIVIKRTSPLSRSYLIKLNNDNIVYCCIDNVRKSSSTSNGNMSTNSDLSPNSMEQSSETSYV